jgi:glycosyltransferase involved in cell wall biosynthesis
MHTPWESTNPQLAKVARGAGIPYIVSVHGMLDDWCMNQRRWKKRIYHALAARRLLEQTAFVHCTASAELEQARRWFPRGKGRVVPLVFDLEPFKALPGPDLARSRYYTLSSRGPKVLFLSRLHPKKGVELLIDAVSGLRKEGADLTLTIAGTGESEYVATLKQRATKLGDRVEFLGMVSGQDKLSVYQAADVLVIPTSQENFGFVFPEALACGTPVVTTKGVDIWPELQTSGGAVIVEPEPRKISAALRKLFMDPAALKDMGAMGRRWVFQELDGARVVERYEALYAEAAGPARSNT